MGSGLLPSRAHSTQCPFDPCGPPPSGLAAAKHALEAGFDVTVFEASDELGGQRHTTAQHTRPGRLLTGPRARRTVGLRHQHKERRP